MDAVRNCLLAALVPALPLAPCAGAERIPSHQAARILAAAPGRPQAEPARPRRALIWITPKHLMEKDPHKGYCIPYGAEAFRVLGTKSGAYQPVVSDDLAMWLPGTLKSFDVVILNNSSGPWITPTDADMERPEFAALGGDRQQVEARLRRSFLDHVRRGGGIAAIHYSIGANRHWPEYHQLLGARMDGHPWNEEVGIRVEEPDHPVLAAFGGKTTVRLADEIFQFRAPYDRGSQRVLLSIDTTSTNMDVKWLRRKDNDWGLAWLRPVGDGRVFYTAIGHRTEIFWNPEILRFYLDGIQFAAGDLQAPAAPR
jgi:type 1 glutamine amidotransferase